jgi:hypothetical protein
MEEDVLEGKEEERIKGVSGGSHGEILNDSFPNIN